MSKDLHSTVITRDPKTGIITDIKVVDSKEISPFDGKKNQNLLSGLDNTNIDETQPTYNDAECETVYEGKNNARIILGRDREHGVVSGYGGRGHTRSGAIDLVVGLQGWSPAEGGHSHKDPDTGQHAWCPPHADRSFGSLSNDKPGDAARIYISQRADIDDYFDLCDGSVGRSVADSAIGMKADSIRIMSRKGIKLVTASNPPGRSSIDGKQTETFGIDLIAGNHDVNDDLAMKLGGEDRKDEIPYLQPIPKGLHLQQLLINMATRIERLNNVCSALIIGMPAMLKSIQMPRVGGNAGGPVSALLPPGPHTIQLMDLLIAIQRYSGDLDVQRKAITAMKQDYLSIGGKWSILSRHNRTN